MAGEPASAATPSLGRLAAGGALLTMGGQLVKTAVQFGGIVLLARLLTPRDYGLFAMVLAIIGVGEVVRDFGLSSAAIQARQLTAGQRDNLFWINTGIGLSLAACMFAAAGAIAGFYHEPLLVPVAQAASVTLLLNGLATQFRADLGRGMRFRSLALADVGGQAAGLGTAIAAALAGWGYWALVLQALAQAATLLALLVLASRWRPGLPRRDADMRPLLRFGGNLMASQLLTYFSNNLGQILVGSRLGPVALGHYNRAFALLMVPLTQLNAPATTVALPVLSRLQDDPARYSAFLLRGQATLMHLLMAGLAFGCALADPLIDLVLGKAWAPAAPLFRILLVGGLFQAAGYAAYWVFLSRDLTGPQLRYSIVSRVLVIACIGIGAQWGVTGVATGYSTGMAISWPLVLWWLARCCPGAPTGGMLRGGARAMAGYGLCGLAAHVASLPLAGLPAPWVLLAGATAMAATFSLLCLLWPAFRRDVAGILHTRTLLRSARSDVSP